jgi:ankyrin repeat protein
MYAARDDAQAGALALAEVGADLDAQDPDGTTALCLAIMNNHYDLAAKLLEAGADPDVADRSGMTALYTAVDMLTLGREIGRPERPHLDELGALDLVRLTLARGADPNARLTAPTIPRHHGFPDRSLSAGATALMRAARSHDLATMRVLLEAGADASITQADGSSVLFSAVAPPPRSSGDSGLAAAKEVVLLALQAGADLRATAANGETVLHRAARQGNATAVRVLVEQGLPLDVRDEMGRTPLDIVTQPGRTANEEIAALLRELALRE